MQDFERDLTLLFVGSILSLIPLIIFKLFDFFVFSKFEIKRRKNRLLKKLNFELNNNISFMERIPGLHNLLFKSVIDEVIISNETININKDILNQIIILRQELYRIKGLPSLATPVRLVNIKKLIAVLIETINKEFSWFDRHFFK